jgi:hypothetical protein
MLSQAINKRMIRLCFIQSQPILMVPQVRYFAVAPPKAAPAQGAAASNKSASTPDVTISQLESIGRENLSQTKVFDYAAIAQPNRHGITNNNKSFTSFEDKINQ